jgi:hypothetical protein
MRAVPGGAACPGAMTSRWNTGAPEQIEAFHRLFEGDGWWGGGGSDLTEFILNPLLVGVFGDSQRSIASRLRRRKLQREAVDDDPTG